MTTIKWFNKVVLQDVEPVLIKGSSLLDELNTISRDGVVVSANVYSFAIAWSMQLGDI